MKITTFAKAYRFSTNIRHCSLLVMVYSHEAQHPIAKTKDDVEGTIIVRLSAKICLYIILCLLEMYIMIHNNTIYISYSHDHVERRSGKSSRSLSARIIKFMNSSTSVPTKVTDDPIALAFIMSEFRTYEQHKQVTYVLGRYNHLILVMKLLC